MTTNTPEIRELTDAELDQTSGARNVGGYTHCTSVSKPSEGLYVGSCNPWADWMNTYFGTNVPNY